MSVNIHQLAFASLKGITSDLAQHLLEHFGSEQTFFEANEAEILHALQSLNHPYADASYRRRLLDDAAREVEFADAHKVKCMYFTEPDYPRRLSVCEDAPLMLHGLGTTDLNSAQMIAIVGTRHATAYGVGVVEKIVSELTERLDNPVIVSGLAFGIDIAAHKAALNAGIPTVAVVAHGLDTLYPSQHRQVAAQIISQGGMIVTEYPSGTRIHRSNFLARNRIIAGLSDCTIVAESAYKGGALSTARIASEYSREVMAVPGRLNDAYSQGCLRIIERGIAHVYTDAEALINLMGWKSKNVAEQPSLFPELNETEQRIIDLLHEDEQLTVNDLSVRLSIPMAVLRPRLIDMEFRNLLSAIPGGRYTPKI